jgi:hypothetical protein
METDTSRADNEAGEPFAAHPSGGTLLGRAIAFARLRGDC